MLSYLLFLAIIFLLVRLVLLMKNQKKSDSVKSEKGKSEDVLDDAKRILNSEED